MRKNGNTMDVCLMNEVLEAYADREDQMEAAFRYGRLSASGAGIGDPLKSEILSLVAETESREKLERVRAILLEV